MKYTGVSQGEVSKCKADFQLLDQGRLITSRVLTAARSKHRLDL